MLPQLNLDSGRQELAAVNARIRKLATLIEETHDELLKNGPRRVSPFFIPGTIINMIAGNLSIMLGTKGPNLYGADPAQQLA